MDTQLTDLSTFFKEKNQRTKIPEAIKTLEGQGYSVKRAKPPLIDLKNLRLCKCGCGDYLPLTATKRKRYIDDKHRARYNRQKQLNENPWRDAVEAHTQHYNNAELEDHLTVIIDTIQDRILGGDMGAEMILSRLDSRLTIISNKTNKKKSRTKSARSVAKS